MQATMPVQSEAIGMAFGPQAAEIAASEADPLEDRRGSADYKRDVVRVLAARALRLAAARPAGDSVPTPLPFTYAPAQSTMPS